MGAWSLHRESNSVLPLTKRVRHHLRFGGKSESTPTLFLGRFPSMAVGTPNVALLDLPLYAVPGVSSALHRPYFASLVVTMVELKDNGVALPAIDTRMLKQVLKQPALIVLDASQVVVPDLLPTGDFSARVPAIFVQPLALLADGVSAIRSTLENPKFSDDLHLPTTGALLRHTPSVAFVPLRW